MSGRPTHLGSWSQMLMTPRVLWGALLVSNVIYGGLVVSGILHVPTPEPDDVDPTFALAFAVAALGTLATSFLLPAKFLGDALARQRGELRFEEREDASAPTLFRDESKRVRFVAEPAVARAHLASLFFTPFVLSLALSESVSIFGLAGYVAGFFPMVVALTFIGVGALFIALRFPTVARLVTASERAWEARWPVE